MIKGPHDCPSPPSQIPDQDKYFDGIREFEFFHINWDEIWTPVLGILRGEVRRFNLI